MTFIKHPEENNKDHNEVQRILGYKKMKYKKTYHRQHCSPYNPRSTQNKLTEQVHRLFVKEIKHLYSTLPNKEDRVIIVTDSLHYMSLHYIITSSLYFFLECDGNGSYRIEYRFHNSPFEQQLRKSIEGMAMKSYSTESVSIEDYNEFYRRMLRTHPEEYIFQLKYNGPA